MPISPVREPNGEWLRLEVPLPGYSLWLRAWQVQVGRVKLFLLDSNDAANFPAHRGITSELYGGGPEMRLMQELVLGISGVRLLNALGIKPEVYHLNEGHAAFAVLERAHSFMKETGLPFDAALAVTRAGNLFTTHTPVAAGFDQFSPELMKQYLGRYTESRLGIPFDELLALGRQNPDDPTEPFNMAYLAIRGSGAVNGVSRLHGEVSRRLFQPLFPKWPEQEVPVGHVTNGVHMPSWESTEADDLWSETCKKDRWLGTTEKLEGEMLCVDVGRFWELRTAASGSLIEYVRDRLCRQLAVSGAPAEEIEAAKKALNPSALTLGFARRFAGYKRPTLLLHDPERLLKILANPKRPVQLIIAGKAHPADLAGQEMIRLWTEFIRRPETRGRVIFLSDYDMLLTERLVQGVDVWINTPRRPWEASGTSGMKVLVNGGLNLSELDGWWAEAYTPEVGWALGDGREHGDDPAWDAAEADELYTLLEKKVIPEFYDRDQNGVPIAWVKRMRESMACLTPQFSANRTVREYTERYYIPAAKVYRKRSADNGASGPGIVEWRKSLNRAWSQLRIGDLSVDAKGKKYLFEAQLYLDNIDPGAVRVELYVDKGDGGMQVVREMKRGECLAGMRNVHVYCAEIEATGETSDYKVRVIPSHPGIAVPLEANNILWQR